MSRSRSRQNWLVPMSRENRAGSAVRLICFPHAGGSAAAYRPWAEAAAPHVDVVGVQLPGRGPRLREELCAEIGHVSAEIVDSIRKLPASPLAFFGHSVGAILAYAIAQELSTSGGPVPRMLFLSAAEPPHLDWQGPRLEGLTRSELDRQLRDLEGTPGAVLANEEFMNLTLPALHADFEMARSYRSEPSRPPLEVPIHVFGGAQDPFADRRRMQRWRELTRATFSLRMLPGGHFYLEPCRARLLAIIGRELADPR